LELLAGDDGVAVDGAGVGGGLLLAEVDPAAGLGGGGALVLVGEGRGFFALVCAKQVLFWCDC
jgi:hypothetical protein